MMRRTLALASGVILLHASLFASSASADELWLDPTQGAAGSTTVATGCGWIIGEAVVLLWDNDSAIGSSVPDQYSDGCIEAAVNIPADATTGEHVITAHQGDRSSSATFLVTEGGKPFGETLLEPKRIDWFVRPRLTRKSDFSRQLLLHARQRADQEPSEWKAHDLVAIAEPTVKGPTVPVDATALSAWANLGPAPSCGLPYSDNVTYACRGSGAHSGRTTAIAVVPGKADMYYIGTSGGGVWKTVNGGQHWIPLFDHMPTLQIGSLAIDPFDPDRILAGTGAEIEESAYLGLGVYRSGDAGKSWSRVGGKMFDGCSIDRIVADPYIRDVFVLAAQVGSKASKCNGGVYVSVDGGTTWKRWLDRSRVWDVAFAGPILFAGVDQEGIYRSSILRRANGDPVPLPNWTQVGGGLPTSNTGRVSIAVAPSDPKRLYVVMGHPKDSSLVYLQGGWTSKDGGSSWTAMNVPTTPDSFLALAVSPSDSSEMYLGAGSLWRTRNAGQSFSPNASEPEVNIHDDVSSLTFDAAGRLLAGTDGGVYRTDSASYPKLEDLNTDLSTMLVYRVAGTLDGGGSVMAGMQDNGAAHYTGSSKWNEVEGGDGGGVGVDPRDTRILYFSYNETHLEKQTPAQAFPAYIGLQAWYKKGVAAFIAPFVLDTARPDVLYFGHDYLWRSPNSGQLWGVVSPSDMWPAVIAPAPSDPKVIYTWSERGTRGMQVTQNGGTDWNPAGWQNPGVVTDIAVHPQHANEVWTTVSGFDHGHVYFSDDYAQTWTDISGFLPNTPANAITLDARRSPASLFLATDVGIFVSYDNGSHWAKTGGGLPNTIVNDVVMDSATNHLLAGTYGRGVWAADVQFEHHVLSEPDAQQFKKTWIAHTETFSTQTPTLVR